MLDQENKNYCTLYIIRHSETEWNVKEIVMGQSDSPLTENGIKQAERLRSELQPIAFDAVFSSDLLRAHRTAQIITLEKKLAIQTSQLLRERAYGKQEGRHSAAYRNEVKELIEKVQQLPDHEKWTFKFGEDIETDDEVIARFITFIREIAVTFANKTVLVVTHGGCIRFFLIHLGYVTYEQIPSGSFKNGGYVKVLSDGIDFIIKEVEGLEKK